LGIKGSLWVACATPTPRRIFRRSERSEKGVIGRIFRGFGALPSPRPCGTALVPVVGWTEDFLLAERQE
jgi:hypothetical protein